MPDPRYLLHTAISVDAFITDHLFAAVASTWKQLAFWPFQGVQKPSLSSFQVPSPLAPARLAGSRVLLPSALNTILNLTPRGSGASNCCPLKKSACNPRWRNL